MEPPDMPKKVKMNDNFFSNISNITNQFKSKYFRRWAASALQHQKKSIEQIKLKITFEKQIVLKI